MPAAAEHAAPLAPTRLQTADSARPPNELMTVGSMSIEQSGHALRRAAAHARRLLLDAAATRLGCDAALLSVEDGVVCAPQGARVTCWELHAGREFGVDVDESAAIKPPAAHRVVGRRAQRLDLEAKLLGSARFVQDLSFPRMLHARVVRHARRDARLIACDEQAARAMPGVVAIVRDGDFLALLAEREEQAVAAAERLRASARFECDARPGGQDGLHERLAQNLVGSYPLVDGVPVEAPLPPIEVPESAVHTVAASYTRPYLMHASLGPAAAAACFEGDQLTVWSASQGVALLAPAIAVVLQTQPARVRAIHVEGPGCYGHNGSDDAALDAALCARAVPGRHVLLKWTRADEHAHEPYGPAMRMDLQASVDASGRVVAWSHEVYSTSHIGRALPTPGRSTLIAAGQLAQPLRRPSPRPMLAPEAGIHRNALPLYDFPRPRVVKHLSREAPLRTSSLRSLGAFGNVFALESMMDELAHTASLDPIAFRLAHLRDERARAVIEACLERAGLPAGRGEDAQRPRGRGLAFARYENHKCYAAVLVELEVDLASFGIRLLRAVIAADAGQIIDPDGLENQLEGGFVQAASFCLKEQVSFDDSGTTSLDWQSYPILGFEEVPPVATVLIDRPERTARGAGEATTGPTPAAIANAVFDATGARLRHTPFTPARLRAAMFSEDST
jgi:CO/xanthine dehydrogenase Mo-binding subunit